MGTSINTGSDKQTYYKLGMCGSEPDSPEAVAKALYSGGSMNGDLAMVKVMNGSFCAITSNHPAQ